MLVNMQQLNRAAILLERAEGEHVGLEDVPAHFPRGCVLVRVGWECFLVDGDGNATLVDALVVAGLASPVAA